MSEDAATPANPQKPRYRGTSHQFAFFMAVGAGAVLVAMAPAGRTTTGAAVFAASLAWLLGVSALYHRPMWPPVTRQWLRRLDHASIFVLIGGTYTPVCLLALPPEEARGLLSLVWGGVAIGLLFALFWVKRPRGITAVIYLALSWVVVIYQEPFRRLLDATTFSLLVAGGLFYSAGALVYALRRPSPLPAIFGYHEVFHALVLLASASHFIAVLLLVRAH